MGHNAHAPYSPDNDFEVFIDVSGTTQYYVEFEMSLQNATYDIKWGKPDQVCDRHYCLEPASTSQRILTKPDSSCHLSPPRSSLTFDDQTSLLCDALGTGAGWPALPTCVNTSFGGYAGARGQWGPTHSRTHSLTLTNARLGTLAAGRWPARSTRGRQPG